MTLSTFPARHAGRWFPRWTSHRASPRTPARFAARWRELAGCVPRHRPRSVLPRARRVGSARPTGLRGVPGPPAVPGLRHHQPDHPRHLGRADRTGNACAPRSGWVRASRRERDQAILATEAAGYTAVAIGRSFGLSRTSVTGSYGPGTTRLTGTSRHDHAAHLGFHGALPNMHDHGPAGDLGQRLVGQSARLHPGWNDDKSALHGRRNG